MKTSAYFRRARPGGGAAFSLFPFLAVLICTMGVLILLLVVISRNIREKAVAAEIPFSERVFNPKFLGLDETATDDQIAEKLKNDANTYEWLTQEMLVSKDATLEQLNDARARVGAIEDSIKKLVKEVERLHEAMKSLVDKKTDPSEDLAKLQKQLDEKLKSKEQAEAELKTLQNKHAEQQRSYAIVPYRGPNGTFRRPIYIECRADGVVIQPEGIVLQAEDFLTPDHRDNPMEMGVRTVRQYFVETQQLQRDTEPYPLFLVRPSGIYAYEAALRSLGSWKGDFGYELIEEDWKLEFPAPSEELKQRLDEQVKIARARQTGYIQSEIARGVLNGGVKRLYRAGSGGGLEPVGVAPGDSNSPLRNALASGAGRYSDSDPGSTGSGRTIPAGGQIAQTGPNRGTSTPAESAGEASGEQTPPGTARATPRYTSQVQGSTEDGSLEKNDGPKSSQGDLKLGMSATSGDPNAQPTGPAVPSLTFEKLTRGSQKEGRQKNWALKNVQQSARPVDRIVRIRCETDRYTILKQPGLFQHKDVPFRGQFSDSPSDRLVKAVWEFMDTWDSAGENHFWRPLLKAQVAPGAEAVFEQMKIDLADSGLGIERL